MVLSEPSSETAETSFNGPEVTGGFCDVFNLLHGPYVTRGRFDGIVPYIVRTARTRQWTVPVNADA
jgi:hypothetical protein